MRPIYVRTLPHLVWGDEAFEFLGALADSNVELHELELQIEEIIGRAVNDDRLTIAHTPTTIHGHIVWAHRTPEDFRGLGRLWLFFLVEWQERGPSITLLTMEYDA